MDSRQSEVGTPSSDSRDTDEPAPPGIPESEHQLQALDPQKKLYPAKPQLTLKGIENAKKRLRAFSIQKRAPISPAPMAKPSTSTNSNTVLIGKLSSIKPSQPKVEDPDIRRPPKPPKPGKRVTQGTDSYRELQKRTLAEIEDMKRKMELVELGIPLGLICPTSGAINEKAMPTKAMPPIKSFLDSKKVDEIISEAKKARAEGKEFKFDYNKLLPDYDNPFQRKKEEEPKKEEEKKPEPTHTRDMSIPDKYNSKRRSHYEKSESRRHSTHKQDDRIRRSDKQNEKSNEGHHKSKDRRTSEKHKVTKVADDNLKGFVVCDSWSLDNDEKTSSSSPQVDDKPGKEEIVVKSQNQTDQVIPDIKHESDLKTETDELQAELLLPPKKIEKLQPVIDSFKFEIDEPNEDDIIDLYDIPLPKKKRYESPSPKNVDDDQSKETTSDSMNDDTFLEAIINEIKKESMDEDLSPEKGLVEYEMSPAKDDDDTSKSSRLGSITPELDDSMRELQCSQRSNYSDGYRSGESGYKSTESGYKSERSSRSSENYRMSMDKDLEDTMDSKITKATAESLETWSFVLKICQPLLFRHDKNKCYKETRATPKLWFAESAKHCLCVKDRMIVYSELETCKTSLVETLYGCDQLTDSPFPTARSWYPLKALESTESATVPVASEWEEDPISYERREQSRVETRNTEDKRDGREEGPQDEMSLDTEYQRFMESVWPGAANKGDSRSTTPTQDAKQSSKETDDKKKGKKMKLSSEGWSQESDVEEQEISKKPKSKEAKEKSRKRKHSVSLSSESEKEETPKKKKKSDKKKSSQQEKKKSKTKLAKTKRSEKKMKKLKEKHKKKKKSLETFVEVTEKETKKKDHHKKSKKKKQLKLKKKETKKKKVKAKSSSSETSSSSSTESSSDTDSSAEVKKKKKKKDTPTKKKKKDKKRDVTSSDSAQSEDLFDVNILKNIKKERETDDEKCTNKMADQEFSPRRQVMKRPEIINVKELQNDFVGNNIHIKQEIIEEDIKEDIEEDMTEESTEDMREEETVEKQDFEVPEKEDKHEKVDFKEPQEIPVIKPILDESNQSQTSSQASHESIASIKLPTYEKDDSHLRPSSQNSNYSFNDVIASQNVAYNKTSEEAVSEENYEPENYDVYEQMALAYQNDVANQQNSEPVPEATEQRIETVVRARITGEIKCDWRAGDENNVDPNKPRRPSRWGLKPGEVNIVLTGANSRQYSNNEQKDRNVYQIESVVSRNDSSCSMSYDEAYMDTYGELDRLQYGDCFGEMLAVPQQHTEQPKVEKRVSTLDARIDLALKNSVLGEVAKDAESAQEEKEIPEKGILVMKSLTESKGFKSVSFADGYKPGQDSDVEDPPKKKKRKRRLGCAWPCAATHPDHVSLWDALPPPPPPDSPPPTDARLQQPSNIPLPMGQQMPMGQQVPPQMGQQMPPQMGQQMPPQMGQQMPPQIGQQLPPQMGQQLPPQMGQQLPPQMGQQMPPQMGQQMPPQMGQQLPPQMGQQLPPQMGQQLPPQMGQQMPPQMGPMGPSMGPPMGQMGPPIGPLGPMMNNIRMPQDMPMGPMPMGQQMSMNGPPITMNQQMQINQQLQMLNNMRMGQEIPMGQMQVQIPGQMMPPHPGQMKFDPSTSLPNFMPPEPPPGLISFN